MEPLPKHWNGKQAVCGDHSGPHSARAAALPWLVDLFLVIISFLRGMAPGLEFKGFGEFKDLEAVPTNLSSDFHTGFSQYQA